VGDEGAGTSASLPSARVQPVPSSWRRPAEELVEVEPGRDRVLWIALVVGVVLCAGVALLIRQAGCAVAPAAATTTTAGAHGAAVGATTKVPDAGPHTVPLPGRDDAGPRVAPASSNAASSNAASSNAASTDAASTDAASTDAGASVGAAAAAREGPAAATEGGLEGTGADDDVAPDGGGRAPRPAPEDDDGVDPDPPPARR